MGHKTHDDVAARWVQRALHGQQSAPAYPSRNLHDEGRSIYSYGHHFEVGRILIDEKTKRPRGWLLNGDRWPGVVTNRHQAAVRSAVAGTGLPVVTLPHEVLTAAGIELDTVSVVDVQADWWTTTEIRKYEPVGKVERDVRYESGGWQNSLTGEFVEREGWSYDKPVTVCDHDIVAPGPWKPGPFNWERDRVENAMHTVHERIHHGEWEEIRTRSINTGRVRRMHSRHIEWEIVDDPESPIGVAYVRETRRHWLGASLVRAAVITSVNAKCKSCSGTGLAAKPWSTYGGNHAIGPLTQEAIYRSESVYQHRLTQYRNGYYGAPSEEPLFGWGIEFNAQHTECRACSGRGKTPTTRRRWAHFLSGFDENETRPSYFFCELPTRASSTVEEAFEELKPEAVRFAEELGREVRRQGDIFAIPLPGLTLQELKQQGGEHLKYTSEMVTETVWGRRSSREVRRRDSFHTAHVLGTNHEASEVVVFADGRTYGRGTLVHSPSGRLPDHRRVTLGKTWHLLVKNTVPIGA